MCFDLEMKWDVNLAIFQICSYMLQTCCKQHANIEHIANMLNLMPDTYIGDTIENKFHALELITEAS